MTNYRTFSFIVTGIVVFIAIASHFSVQALDKATAHQCRTHDWPVAAHQIHMDWCADNGYVTNWVRKHGTGRCKSFLSYYHPPRVVTFIAMAIRKAIAVQLSNAAKALEKDQTKEQAGKLINGIRISLANVIMPNIPLSK